MSIMNGNKSAGKGGRGKGKPEFPSLEEALSVVPKIHGHICTASYLGTRMGLYAMKHLQLKRKRDLCVGVEILTCAADGIAAATQCSYGSGRMVLLDHGKFAAIFVDKQTGKGVRITCKESVDREHIAYGKKLAEFYKELDSRSFEEALKEREKLKKEEDMLIEKWSRMKDEELFNIKKIEADPKKLMMPLSVQYIVEPEKCSICGEITEKSKMIEKDGKLICKICSGEFEIKIE